MIYLNQCLRVARYLRIKGVKSRDIRNRKQKHMWHKIQMQESCSKIHTTQQSKVCLTFLCLCFWHLAQWWRFCMSVIKCCFHWLTLLIDPIKYKFQRNTFFENISSSAIFSSCAHKHNHAENPYGRKLKQKNWERDHIYPVSTIFSIHSCCYITYYYNTFISFSCAAFLKHLYLWTVFLLKKGSHLF